MFGGQVNKLQIRKPKLALAEVWFTLIQEEVEDGREIELVIRISDKNLSVRDLSAFLNFVDSIYGRLSKEGLQSYSRRSPRHLKISQIRQGSCELVLDGVISKIYPHAELLVIIWLAVKYLPVAVQSVASAYNEFEQARLARMQRKQIRHNIELDEVLRNLDVKRKKEIVDLLNSIYDKEYRKLSRVNRFVRRALIDIFIKLK